MENVVRVFSPTGGKDLALAELVLRSGKKIQICTPMLLRDDFHPGTPAVQSQDTAETHVLVRSALEGHLAALENGECLDENGRPLKWLETRRLVALFARLLALPNDAWHAEVCHVRFGFCRDALTFVPHDDP